jgi:glycolate oxidase FAD binding subunit
MSVEAGLTLAALNAHLRQGGQFLPIDVPWPERTTVGGLVATASAGPYRARYGTLRDLLLGVTVVESDGTVVKGGGRVVKNVTGYDVTRLHVGALGTLGVVVECHLRLHPRPIEEGSWLIAFPGPEAALAAALAVRATPVEPSRLQLLDGGALAGLGHAAAGAAALAMTVGSVPAAVRAQGERIREVCRDAGGRELAVGDPEAFWIAVARLTWAAPDDPALTLRVGTRPTDLAKALAAVEEARPPGTALRASADVPSGVLHVRVDGVPPADAAGTVDRARAAISALGGSLVVEHAPGGSPRSLDVWGDVGPARDLMVRLKAERDPAGLLNPGRFVGGI